MAKITGYERQNEKVIKAAFARFAKSKDMTIRMGMYRLLEDAVKARKAAEDELFAPLISAKRAESRSAIAIAR